MSKYLHKTHFTKIQKRYLIFCYIQKITRNDKNILQIKENARENVAGRKICGAVNFTIFISTILFLV